MEAFTSVLTVVTICLNLFSIIVLVWGVIVAGKDFFLANFKLKSRMDRSVALLVAKNRLGGYVLLGLEILIVADIIESILKPTFEDILKLAAIVAIRTVISYFLNKEIREAGIKSSMIKQGDKPED